MLVCWCSLHAKALATLKTIRRPKTRPCRSASKMLLELIFSSFAIFNLVLLTPMLGLSPRKLKKTGLQKNRFRKAPCSAHRGPS